MTFVGKILVVLHLVLAVVFMAFAGAIFTAQANWRLAKENTQKQLDAAKRELGEKTTALTQAADTAAKNETELQGQVTQLTGEKNALTLRNTSLEAEAARLKALANTEQKVAGLSTSEAEQRLLEAQLQRARNLELEASRNELITANNKLSDEIFSAKVKLDALVAKHEESLREIATMKSYLASKDLPTDTKSMVVSTTPPPPVTGVVMDLRPARPGSSETVEISLGSDDGLTKGHILTIYRADRYLGKVRLNFITPDRAVGEVVERTKNSVIQRGDNVTTRL
ncbi:MAG: hypothetical protein C0478_02045 [Planctomyces sp.]|jgi:chromosome segregation ATPase|nr:hypothetical protein [Planctomyces sp.]